MYDMSIEDTIEKYYKLCIRVLRQKGLKYVGPDVESMIYNTIWKTHQNFDSTKGASFQTLLITCIKHAHIDLCRKKDKISDLDSHHHKKVSLDAGLVSQRNDETTFEYDNDLKYEDDYFDLIVSDTIYRMNIVLYSSNIRETTCDKYVKIFNVPNWYMLTTREKSDILNIDSRTIKSINQIFLENKGFIINGD